MSERIPVAVAGATGSVGQRFVALLDGHPWFDLVALTASPRSVGKRYADAVRWVQSTPLPETAGAMTLQPSAVPLASPARLVFSALDSSVAFDIESAFAGAGALVVSNARSHRLEPDVPLVVPEVNPEHVELARASRHRPGAILTNPNCSTIGLALALKPLHDAFGVRRVHVVTLQAVSGAGLPGVSSYEILDNVVPFIEGEEEKIERESRKIFGTIVETTVEEAEIAMSAQCTRVPVTDGHLLCVSVELGKKADASELRDAWTRFSAAPQELSLPSAPAHPIVYVSDERGPQPRLHRDLGGGMTVSVGRLRPCSLLDYKFVALSHNTVRGAAGGALLLAELAHARGLVTRGPELRSTEVAR